MGMAMEIIITPLIQELISKSKQLNALEALTRV
jgi:phosphoribulokinase